MTFWGNLFCKMQHWNTSHSHLHPILNLRLENGTHFLKNIYKFIYFNWRLITLQYCDGFCHTLTWIRHRCTCVPNPEHPSHLPPHPIPLGHPSAPTPSTLSYASNLDWRFISHMIIYIFQCHSSKSSHPRPLPQSSKDCFIHLCLFCWNGTRLFQASLAAKGPCYSSGQRDVGRNLRRGFSFLN